MRWRVDFTRRTNGFTKAGQAGMKWSVEIAAKDQDEAKMLAMAEAQAVGKSRMYEISKVRKI